MLELTGDHIAGLNDEDLRQLIVKLCEAELRRVGGRASTVLAGGRHTANDGGVDVRVEPSLSMERLDFIPHPNTVFQSKCEDMPAAKIKEEMCPKGALRQSIKELIASGGAYVIVSSKGTVADAFLIKRREAMKAAIADQPNAARLTVDFYDRDRLARWVRQYAGVEMWVRGKVNARLQGWQGYDAWADAGADSPYLYDNTARLVQRSLGGPPKTVSIEEGIDELRAVLAKSGQAVRLVGLSGTGKTRLVQALFEAGLGKFDPLDQAQVLYTDLGHSPSPNAREMLLSLGAVGQHAIVVVDNCNPSTHGVLGAVVRQYSQFLSLLTVEYDVAEEDSSEATEVFELTPASEEVTEGLLMRRFPDLSAPDRRRIAEFSGGNARVALALARTVGRGETLGVLNDSELFRRLFRQEQPDSEDLMRAAEACSLVYSFEGQDTGSLSELQVLAGLVGSSARELFRHVNLLVQRDLVQTRSRWRALLPPALANRLAKTALQSIPSSDVVDALASNERLLASFSRRLQYLHDSEEARLIAIYWLGDERWLGNPEGLNPHMRKLFVNISPLVPQQVLRSLKRVLDQGNAANFFVQQSDALHEWTSLLRHLAYEADAFEIAAPLLLNLAECEDDSSIDCRRGWQEMFRIGLSGTLAPPAQRVQMLDRLRISSTAHRRNLVWDAAFAMLETSHIDSSHEFSFGARPHGYGWEPTSNKDVGEWLDAAFQLIRRIAESCAEGHGRARAAMAANFRSLWMCGMVSQLSALMQELAGNSGWPAGWIAVKNALRFDGGQMSVDALAALRSLGVFLAPVGLLQEIRTYALSQSIGQLDIESSLDDSDKAEEENPVNAWKRADEKVVALGAAAATDEAALVEALPELLATDTGRQQLFGKGLGEASLNPTGHWTLLTSAFVCAPDSPNVAVLAGFLQGLRTRSLQNATSILDTLNGHSTLDKYYPVILGIPQDDDDGDRLIAAMRRGTANPYRFILCTRHGRTHGLSVEKFCEAVQILSDVEGGLLAAIGEIDTELRQWKSRKESPPDAMIKIGRELVRRFDFVTGDRQIAWRLNQLVEIAFSGPEAADAVVELARRFAQAMFDSRTHGDGYGRLACTLFKLHPTIALDAFLGGPIVKRRFGLSSNFIAHHGPVIECAPEGAILNWIRDEPEVRAPLVAAEIRLASISQSGEVSVNSLVTQLLEIASDKPPVLNALLRDLHPSYWSGSLEQTLQASIFALKILAVHEDMQVSSWAQETLRNIDRRIEQDRQRESLSEQAYE